MLACDLNTGETLAGEREFQATLGYTTRPCLKKVRLRRWFRITLQHKHEDLIQNPRNPHKKPGAVSYACNPALGNGDRIAGAFWLPALTPGSVGNQPWLKGARHIVIEQDTRMSSFSLLKHTQPSTLASIPHTNTTGMCICEHTHTHETLLKEREGDRQIQASSGVWCGGACLQSQNSRG